MMQEIWSYREGLTGAEISGYDVEARDGAIGKIDMASTDPDSCYIVVDTGSWIFGKKVLLPAGVIGRIDHDNLTVDVDLSKDEIKAAPEYDELRPQDASARGPLGIYYAELAGRDQ